MSILEHGIHPPSRDNPWHTPEISDDPYVFKAHEGVFHVYVDEEHALGDEALDYPYPNLETFVTDMNTMCQMIADGPL